MAAVKFKVGDKVKIKRSTHGHHFKKGEIVTITQIYEQKDPQKSYYRADNENDYWYVNDGELYAKKIK
jgi:hypothetical protein